MALTFNSDPNEKYRFIRQVMAAPEKLLSGYPYGAPLHDVRRCEVQTGIPAWLLLLLDRIWWKTGCDRSLLKRVLEAIPVGFDLTGVQDMLVALRVQNPPFPITELTRRKLNLTEAQQLVDKALSFLSEDGSSIEGVLETLCTDDQKCVTPDGAGQPMFMGIDPREPGAQERIFMRIIDSPYLTCFWADALAAHRALKNGTTLAEEYADEAGNLIAVLQSLAIDTRSDPDLV